MYYEMIGFHGEHQSEHTVDGVPEPKLDRSTLFLDFDGTLVELADRPDAIEVDAGMGDLLRALSAKTDGRVVIITGRAIEDVQQYLQGFDGPIIGGHGAQERQAGEIRNHELADPATVGHLGTMTAAFAATHEGLICEQKPTGVVLHFRQNEDLASQAYAFLRALSETHDGFDLHHSKMAYELRPAGIGKDVSMRRMMESGAFAGTMPIFFGDDVTDEPALHWVAEQGGIAVKVGEGETAAGCRLKNPEAARRTLRRWAEA
ncbi:trehalose-phosphatase [Limimaricola hongkongensis]|uniref:Trehalose 6-phosphate phosphatase n=1 Tax=Limimaricola hongkongensis DSM 17492 TaxID=1122180 RepID=A0A017HA29_9RHOB|nr:trehalose-phosphatase [Limimaricola hongkongensis]EYD71362.1 Trehalose-6-phosphate phosphatase [Limimaricola hongkongensis DSM 17492]